MLDQDLSRRTLLKGGGAAVAGLNVMHLAGPAQAFPGQDGGEVVPWLDQPTENPNPDVLVRQLDWERLDTWLTPPDQFFVINHYGQPGGLDAAAWRVGIDGLVARPQALSITDLRARPREEVHFTMECSGNSSAPFAIGLVGNARWAGTPLAPLLLQAGVLKEGVEVVFWGVDAGTVTIRDNAGVVAAGRTGTTTPDDSGGLDLTITEHFARSMSLEDALEDDNLLCYEMNGAPLPPEHGFPVRLIAPGWYGVANVKWLTRIEVRASRFQGRFMAREYVSIREETHGGATVWTFSSVTHDRLKSAPAKVTRRKRRYTIMGAAWGAPITGVEVQIDDGPWLPARLKRQPVRDAREFAWRFWTFDWGRPAAGEHTIRSRAYDDDGNVQPAPDDPFLASRVTFWEANGQIARRIRIP